MKKKNDEPKSITLSSTSCWAILTFPLPDEQESYDDARLGSALRCAMSEFYNQHIRLPMKHGDLNKTEYKILDGLREKFFECINEYEAGHVV